MLIRMQTGTSNWKTIWWLLTVEHAVSMQRAIPYLSIYLRKMKTVVYTSTEKLGPINTVELPGRNKMHTHMHESQNVLSGRSDTEVHPDDSRCVAWQSHPQWQRAEQWWTGEMAWEGTLGSFFGERMLCILTRDGYYTCVELIEKHT